MEICHYCEQKIENVTKDHLLAKSKIKKILRKGEDLPDDFSFHKNIVPSCEPCNYNKGNKDYDSFKSLGVKAILHLKKIFLNRQYKCKKVPKRYKVKK